MTITCRPSAIALALGMALAGCDGGADQPVAAPTPTPTPVASPKPLAALPPAVTGRWGALPTDCAGKGGATAMTVAATTLTFSNSKAKVSEIVEIRPMTYTATLDYTNRMGNWSSPTTMTVRDAGTTLQRQDTHPSSMTTYTRCPA